MKILTGLILSGTLLFNAGCYSYRAANLDGVAAGTAIRARLTPSGAESVPQVADDRSRQISGILVESDADSLVLDVWRTDLRGVRVFQPGLMRVALPWREVVDVSERRLSYARTGVLAAALGVGVYQVVRLLWAGAGGTSDIPGPGGGPELIVCCR